MAGVAAPRNDMPLTDPRGHKQVENDPTLTAVQALEGVLAAVTLNRALIDVHFPDRDES
jgi:hypothetical protein